MTPEEALAAVKRAVESLPEEGDDIWAWPHSYEEIKAVITTLHTIAPDGPLVCVPRKATEAMLRAGEMADADEHGPNYSPRDADIIYRAMIAEGEAR